MASAKAVKWIGIFVAFLLVFVLAVLLIVRNRGRADLAQGTARPSLEVTSASFGEGKRMPARLTCEGMSLSPQVAYSGEPTGTKSLALVMDDLDAPFGFVHWLVYNIPVDSHALVEGASSQKKLATGTTEGKNSDNAEGYFGPCPPGSTPHHYAIRMYALDIGPGLPPGMGKQQLGLTVRGHVLAEGQWTGIYGQSGH